jgi:hypothetical protein
MDLKSKLLRTLFEWMSITTSPELLSFKEFLDSLVICLNGLLTLVHILCTEGSYFLIKF